jgi:hypothetical protein
MTASIRRAAQTSIGPVARRCVLGGVAACLLVLAVASIAPEAVLRAWLAAAFFWTSLPIGGLMILMMMRLIPGSWNPELMLAMEAASLLMPLAAAMFLPVLIGLRALYPWPDQVQETAFRALYLSQVFFIARTVLWFALLGGLVALLIRRREWSTPVSCIGLILFSLAGTVVTTDWLMMLDPEFRSSGFGLYAMSVQATIAIAAGTTVALTTAGVAIRKPEITGRLLLTALLLWAYFSYMQYVVIWSNDLPHLIDWYLDRSAGLWGAILWVFALVHAVALALLILPPVQRRPSFLIGIALAVLVGKFFEAAWIVLPAGGRGVTALTLGAFAIASAGLGAIFAVSGGLAYRARIHARGPKGGFHS